MTRRETRVLPIDAASVTCGYCLLIAETERLVEQGVLKGVGTGDGAATRIRSIMGDLGPLVRDLMPDVVLVEVPLGKQHTREPEKESGFAVWGCGAGTVWGWLECYAAVNDNPFQVIPISNVRWMKNWSKTRRQFDVTLQFRGQYDPDTDPGMDVSDAIAMGLWWSRRRNDARIRRARARADKHRGAAG